MRSRIFVAAALAALLGIACSDNTEGPAPIGIQDILDAPTEVTIGNQSVTILPAYRLGPAGEPLLVMPEVRALTLDPDGSTAATVVTLWAIIGDKLVTFSHPVPGQDGLAYQDGKQASRRRYFEDTKTAYATDVPVVFGARLQIGTHVKLVRSAQVSLHDPTPPVGGQTLFDNFQGSYLSDPGSPGFLFSGPDFVFPWSDEAARFTVPGGGAAAFALSSVQLPVRADCPPDRECAGSTFTLSLYDDANDAPGAELESTVVTSAGPSSDLLTVWFSGTTMLNAGQTYWVVVKGVRDSGHVWLGPNPAVDDGIRKLRTDYFWRSGGGDPAFVVSGVPQ